MRECHEFLISEADWNRLKEGDVLCLCKAPAGTSLLWGPKLCKDGMISVAIMLPDSVAEAAPPLRVELAEGAVRFSSQKHDQ